MYNSNEIEEINNIVNNASALISLAIDYSEFKSYTPLQVSLECSQKFLSEALERLSRLW